MRRFLWVLCVIPIGCSTDQPDVAAPRLNQPDTDAAAPRLKSTVLHEPPPAVKEPPPSYKFTFHAPKQHNFRTGESISCRFTVGVPDGARPPSKIILETLRGELIMNQCFVEPEGDPEHGDYHFKKAIDAPEAPGRYQLRVKALLSITYFGDSKKIQREHHEITSQLFDINVQKKN